MWSLMCKQLLANHAGVLLLSTDLNDFARLPL
jgi:hypothetical protein